MFVKVQQNFYSLHKYFIYIFIEVTEQLCMKYVFYNLPLKNIENDYTQFTKNMLAITKK